MNWLEGTLARMDDWDKAGMVFCLAILVLCLGTFIWSAWTKRRQAHTRKWMATMKEQTVPVVPVRGPTIRLSPEVTISELLNNLRFSGLVLSNDPGTGQLVLHRRKQ
jgi:hypothetical protein